MKVSGVQGRPGADRRLRIGRVGRLRVRVGHQLVPAALPGLRGRADLGLHAIEIGLRRQAPGMDEPNRRGIDAASPASAWASGVSVPSRILARHARPRRSVAARSAGHRAAGTRWRSCGLTTRATASSQRKRTQHHQQERAPDSITIKVSRAPEFGPQKRLTRRAPDQSRRRLSMRRVVPTNAATAMTAGPATRSAIGASVSASRSST